MNKPAIAIIEDEIPAARLLHSMIARLRPEWDITVIPGSVEEATEWFATHPHPDLLFLDIQLADGNSFDFLSATATRSTFFRQPIPHPPSSLPPLTTSMQSVLSPSTASTIS